MISISILLQKNENLFYLLLNQINIYNLSFIIMILAQRSQTLNTGILALCFMGLFTAYSSFQNIISSLYTQLGYFNLGEIILICIYVSFALGSIFCKFIIQKLGYRKSMFISSFSYGLFMWSGLLVSSCENSDHQYCNPAIIYTCCILITILTGVSASIIWVAQSGYITRISDQLSKEKLFALFFSIFFLSQIFSNLFTTFGLGKLSPSTYFIIIGSIGTIISFGFLFLQEPQLNQDQQKPQSIIATVYKIKSIIMQTDRAFYINCFYVFTGIGNGFYTAFLYKLINKSYNPNPDQSKADLIKDIVYHTGLVFFCLGGTQVIIGFFLNRYGSSFHYFKMCIIGVLISQMALILSLLIYFLNSYPLCFVCAALWGAADTILRTYINVFVSKEFKGVLEAFSVFRIFNSIGVCFVVVLNLSLRQTNADEYIIILILLAFQIFAIFCGLNLQSTSGTIYSNNPESKTDLRDQLLDD